MYNWRNFIILDDFCSENASFQDKYFQTKFRLNKEAFIYVLNEIRLREGVRSTYIPPIFRLAATLEILAGGGYQWQTGGARTAPMGHSTLSKIFRHTLSSMEEHLCRQWIVFEKYFQECKEWFSEKHNFPGVVGTVDGTHLQLLKPVGNEHIYFNRKGRHSINAMIICDHKMIIKAICPQYGGAAHDSFVWKASNERMVMERRYNNGDTNSWLLGKQKHQLKKMYSSGDSGYPLDPWLMTPYRLRENEVNAGKSIFNDIHSQARSIVERTIGVYKGRWRILPDDRKPRYNPTIVAKIANVCAALHNLCIRRNIPLQSNNESVTSLQEGGIQSSPPERGSRESERTRNRIKDHLFQSAI